MVDFYGIWMHYIGFLCIYFLFLKYFMDICGVNFGVCTHVNHILI